VGEELVAGPYDAARRAGEQRVDPDEGYRELPNHQEDRHRDGAKKPILVARPVRARWPAGCAADFGRRRCGVHGVAHATGIMPVLCASSSIRCQTRRSSATKADSCLRASERGSGRSTSITSLMVAGRAENTTTR